jgi:hypothetical protein
LTRASVSFFLPEPSMMVVCSFAALHAFLADAATPSRPNGTEQRDG